MGVPLKKYHVPYYDRDYLNKYTHTPSPLIVRRYYIPVMHIPRYYCLYTPILIPNRPKIYTPEQIREDALRSLPKISAKLADAAQGSICTTAHCVRALWAMLGDNIALLPGGVEKGLGSLQQAFDAFLKRDIKGRAALQHVRGSLYRFV